MMIPERPALERRVLTALEGSPDGGPRIPVLLGGCGSGRTSLLLRLRDLIGRSQAQYIDVERVATTPERFLQAMRDASPFPAHPYGQGANEQGARDAFDASLAFLDTSRIAGDAPATFLLDEFLELRTFESFPGLRSVLKDLIGAISASGTRFGCCATHRPGSRSSTSRRCHRARSVPRSHRPTTKTTIHGVTTWRAWCTRCRTGARSTPG